MKKIPMRKCLVSQEQFPKQELIRVVLTPEKEILIDETGRINGRGAYLRKDLEVIEKAEARKVLDRALKTKVDASVYEKLKQYVS
ncbi:MAG TPA: YlxR family protein [Erysipelothrix sp.]|nr:YlxR family protein [Erysipelothrix sp.]